MRIDEKGLFYQWHLPSSMRIRDRIPSRLHTPIISLYIMPEPSSQIDRQRRPLATIYMKLQVPGPGDPFDGCHQAFWNHQEHNPVNQINEMIRQPTLEVDYRYCTLESTISGIEPRREWEGRTILLRFRGLQTNFDQTYVSHLRLYAWLGSLLRHQTITLGSFAFGPAGLRFYIDFGSQ